MRAIITALAVCHNVTPVVEEDATTGDRRRAYQASSPDEVALVKFTETVGLTLSQRTFRTITLTNPEGAEEVRRGAIARGHTHRSLTNACLMQEFEVLDIFPFTSETKRMGIIVREKATDVITFYVKGADAVMSRIVQYRCVPKPPISNRTSNRRPPLADR